MKTLKIVIITPYQNYFGGVEQINELIKVLFEGYGHKVDFFTLENVKNNTNINCFMKKLIGDPYLLSTEFNKQKNKFDIVICNGEFSFGIHHPNCINIFHGSYYGFNKYLNDCVNFKTKIGYIKNSIIQKVGAKDKYVIAVSDFISEILEKQGIKVNKIINNGVDIDLFKPISNFKRNGYIFVGSNNYYAKGFDILENLAAQGVLISCVTNKKPSDSLIWIKNIKNHDLPKIYNKYKALIFPSRFESVGLAPLEAMACGLPIVMGPVGIGLKLQKEIPEFVVDRWDSDSIKEYKERLVLFDNNYDEFSRKARDFVVKNYDLSFFKKNWINTIGELQND